MMNARDLWRLCAKYSGVLYKNTAHNEATRRQAYEVIVDGLRQARKLLGD